MQTSECQKARAQIAAYIHNGNQDRGELEAAITHMRTCTNCLRHANYLLKAVSVADQDTMTCEECQEQLPEYMFAQSSKQPRDSTWRAIELHMMVCERCTKALDELAELSAFGNRERGIEPPSYPTPQLSFLRTESVVPQPIQPRWWQLDQVGHLLIKLSGDLLDTLQPPSQLAYAAIPHKAGASPILLWQIILDDELDDLAVHVVAMRMPDDMEHCLLTVDVDVPSRGGWPELAGSRVTLRLAGSVFATQETDAFGKTAFKDITITDLLTCVIEVERLKANEE